MTKGRLEAFSDGVIAILITIMVLELHAPHEPTWQALLPRWPVILSYLLSFIHIGIYWNNHHHLLQAAKQVDGRILWANLHLLFWLSLIPFATSWMGESHFAAQPVALYAAVLLLAGFGYNLLVRSLRARHPRDSKVMHASGTDAKGYVSLVTYLLAIPIALYLSPAVACGLITVVAIMWLVPDRRIERVFHASQGDG